MSASLDQIYSAILELKGEVGGVRADAKNAQAFAASVSRKADIIRGEVQAVNGKLDEHKEDDDAHGGAGKKLDAHEVDDKAHGLEAERRGGHSVAWIIVAAVSILGGFAGMLSAFGIIGR